MPKDKKPTKAHPQVRVMKADLMDMIRDELYSYKLKDDPWIIMPADHVKKLAKRIAMRSMVGH